MRKYTTHVNITTVDTDPNISTSYSIITRILFCCETYINQLINLCLLPNAGKTLKQKVNETTRYFTDVIENLKGQIDFRRVYNLIFWVKKGRTISEIKYTMT